MPRYARTMLVLLICLFAGGSGAELARTRAAPVQDYGCDQDDGLTWNVSPPIWECGTPSGAGNVIGPAGNCVDNALPRFDGITGELLDCTGVVVDNSGNVAMPAALAVVGPVTGLSFTATGGDPLDGGAILPDTEDQPNDTDANEIALRDWDGVLYQQILAVFRTILSLALADTHVANAVVVSDGTANGAATTPVLVTPTGMVSGQVNFPTYAYLMDNTSLSASTVSSVDTGTDTITTTAAHGYADNQGPFLLTTVGIVHSSSAFIATGWSYGQVFWIDYVSTTEFKIAATPGGSVLDITATGAATGTHTITPLATLAMDNQIAVMGGSDGKLLEIRGSRWNVNDQGNLGNSTAQSTANGFIAAGTHPNPAIQGTDRGYTMANISTADGSPRQPVAGQLRQQDRNQFLTLTGIIGVISTGTNQARVLTSSDAPDRWTCEQVMLSDLGYNNVQFDGDSACANFSGRACAKSIALGSTADEAAFSGTWKDCADDIPAGDAFVSCCSTVLNP